MIPEYLFPLSNHLWQSTVFASGAALLTLALRRNHARARHGLWLAASLKFLIPFSLLTGVGSHLGGRTTAAAARSALSSPGLSVAIQEIGQPFSPPKIHVVAHSANPVSPLLPLAVWLCGAVAVVLFWCVRWRRARAAVHGSVLLGDGREREALLRLQQIGQLRSQIELRASNVALEPGVFGVFRPALLLPCGIADRMTDAQLDAIITHELCHVRRRDNLTSAIHMAVEAMFWFHPMVWWLGARLVDERERACDEEVLRLGSSPEVYAEGILKVCKFYLESPLACVAGVTGSNLKKRIEDIMTNRISLNLDLARKALLAVAGIGAVAAPIGIGLLNPSRTFGQSNTSQYTFGLTTVAEKRFEVASVKPGPPGDDGWNLGVPTRGGISITNMELKKIIASSFRTQDSTVNGPSWIESARYTIVAKGADPTVGNPVVWEMMRSLLAERFQLRYHIETREGSVLALVVAKGGPKVKRPEDGSCADAIKRNEHCANLRFNRFGIGITNMPMGGLLSGLARVMEDRHLVDKTGLTGFYDMDVSLGSRGLCGTATRKPSGAPSPGRSRDDHGAAGTGRSQAGSTERPDPVPGNRSGGETFRKLMDYTIPLAPLV